MIKNFFKSVLPAVFLSLIISSCTMDAIKNDTRIGNCEAFLNVNFDDKATYKSSKKISPTVFYYIFYSKNLKKDVTVRLTVKKEELFESEFDLISDYIFEKYEEKLIEKVSKSLESILSRDEFSIKKTGYIFTAMNLESWMDEDKYLSYISDDLSDSEIDSAVSKKTKNTPLALFVKNIPDEAQRELYIKNICYILSKNISYYKVKLFFVDDVNGTTLDMSSNAASKYLLHCDNDSTFSHQRFYEELK